MDKSLALLAIGALAGGYGAGHRNLDYEIKIDGNPFEPIPRKYRRKGRKLSDLPFGPPSPFETRQQRRYRERQEAKQP